MLAKVFITQCDLHSLADEYAYKLRLFNDADPRFSNTGDTIHERGYLTKDELYDIALWKSPRTAKKVLGNSQETIKITTRVALRLADDPHCPPSIGVAILATLRGVGIPMASTILCLCNPNRFAIIDIFAWQSLEAAFALLPLVGQNRRRRSFQPEDYDRYMEIVLSLAGLTAMTAREIDMALWQKQHPHESHSRHRRRAERAPRTSSGDRRSPEARPQP